MCVPHVRMPRNRSCTCFGRKEGHLSAKYVLGWSKRGVAIRTAVCPVRNLYWKAAVMLPSPSEPYACTGGFFCLL